MHCSRCRVEYRDGFSVCADCGARLLQGAPPSDATPVEVFECGDAALVAVVKSMLQDARIPFEVRGETPQDDIFTGGRAGSDAASGRIRFFVSSEDAADARYILASLPDPSSDEAESRVDEDPEQTFSELLDLEMRGWEALSTSAEAAREFYASVLHEECVMIFPGGLLLEGRGDILESFDSNPWSSFDIAEPRSIWLAPGASILIYRVRAERSASGPYAALVSSTYLRLGDEWVLAAHQQTTI